MPLIDEIVVEIEDKRNGGTLAQNPPRVECNREKEHTIDLSTNVGIEDCYTNIVYNNDIIRIYTPF